MRILRSSDHTEMPWRNGGGTTLEVARFPATAGMEDFDWRMSFARVDQGGPFSAFPGIDRVILLLRGGRMVLTAHGADGDEVHDLDRFEPWAFAGEVPVTSRITEPSLDFNVMTRRGVLTSQVEVHRLEGSLALPARPGRRFVVVLDGSLAVGGEQLGALDLADLGQVLDSALLAGSDAMLADVVLTPAD